MPAAQEKPHDLPRASAHPAAVAGWHELQVANPSFLVEKLGADCTDLQGLRELTVNGLEAMARAPAGGSSGISTGSASTGPAAGCGSCR